jgi:surface antigen
MQRWIVAVIVGVAPILNGCIIAGTAVMVRESNKSAEAAVSKVAVPIRPQFDWRDQEAHDAAFATAMSSAAQTEVAHWNNPATGDSGTIEAAAIEPGASQTCRQVAETYVKSGQTYNGNSRFCRSGDADWKSAES